MNVNNIHFVQSLCDPFWTYFGPILDLLPGHRCSPKSCKFAIFCACNAIHFVPILDLFWTYFGPIIRTRLQPEKLQIRNLLRLQCDPFWTYFGPILDLFCFLELAGNLGSLLGELRLSSDQKWELFWTYFGPILDLTAAPVLEPKLPVLGICVLSLCDPFWTYFGPILDLSPGSNKRAEMPEI